MNTKTVISLLVFAGLAFGGAWYYKNKFSVAPPDEFDSTTLKAVSSQKKVGAKTLQLLNQVNSLNLDTEFFAGPAFTFFTSYEVEIPDQPVGRINPFAPLPKKATSSKNINLPPITY